MKTIKSVYKIGNGPSSSHTVGPFHAAQIFGKRYPEADHFRVTLYGSLAFTGEGHGTGKAVVSGLPGAEVVYDRKETDLPHPNTMLFEAFRDSALIGSNRIFSLSAAAPFASRARNPTKRSRCIHRGTLPRYWTPVSGTV